MKNSLMEIRRSHLRITVILVCIISFFIFLSAGNGNVPVTTQIYLIKTLCPDVKTLGVMTSNLDDRLKQILSSQQMTPPRQITIRVVEVSTVWDVTGGLNTLVSQESADAVLILDSELTQSLSHRDKRAIIDFMAKKKKKLITFNRDWVASGAFMGFEKSESIKILYNNTTMALLQYKLPDNLSPDIQQMVEVME